MFKIKRSAPKAKLAAIATKAANTMARKTTWCQGSWAQTKDGDEYEVLYGKNACTLPSVAAMQSEAKRSAEYVPSNYFEANSPKAQKFCVEGAIYRAAGKVYKRIVPGYKASEQVIRLLDAKVEADPTTDYDSGQGLNDSNGDASRKRLVEHLRSVAEDLS